MKTAVHQYEDKLLEFAYGELPAPEAAAVDAHVRGCARCTEALSQIHSVRNTMSQLPLVPAPDAGLESLLAYAEQTAKRNAQQKKQAVWWRRYLMPLASATALLLVGVVAWRASQEFNPDPGMVALEMQKEREAPSAATSAPVAQAPAPPERKAADTAKSEAVAAGMPAAEPAGGDEGGPGGEVARDNEARQGTGSTEARLDDANKKVDSTPMRSKLGSLTEEQQEAWGDKAGGKVPLPSKPKPAAKASKSKRDASPADAPMPETKTADQQLADDFSNAAQRGAYKQAPPAKPAPQPTPDTSAELSKNQNTAGNQAVWGPKSTPGFGLGTGSVGTSGGGSAVGGIATEDLKANAEPAMPAKKEAQDKPAEKAAEKKKSK
ncbi:MAG: zf-HC2 domain-containing protein, partial [Myxococcota bacterium]